VTILLVASCGPTFTEEEGKEAIAPSTTEIEEAKRLVTEEEQKAEKIAEAKRIIAEAEQKEAQERQDGCLWDRA